MTDTTETVERTVRFAIETDMLPPTYERLLPERLQSAHALPQT